MAGVTDAICEAIATQTPFTAREVRAAYDACKSFDVIVIACNLAADMGYGNLTRAVQEVIWERERPTPSASR